MITFLIGCNSKNINYEFYIKNIDNGVLTYTNGEDFFHKIFSTYEITNLGFSKSPNAILKVNIYHNDMVIYQEIKEITPLNNNENITIKISFNYDNHQNNNQYMAKAEILVEFNQVLYIEDIIN